MVRPQTAMEATRQQTIINCIRFLAVDAIEKAKSGHPGMPMGAAPTAFTLFDRFLRHCPDKPDWPDRDRFVLSAGHGSMLLYALLHLSGYDLPLEQLKHFRQWDSRTPGHPEYGHTPGVETTTGPLGQGLANAVGMAIAERHLAARFNKPGFDLVNHFAYVIVGDGCLMEGISHEAASLAGHLALGRLIVLYDDNHVSIDGPTEITFTEDVCARFEAYGWHTQRVADGNDCEAIAGAMEKARAATDKPSLIAVRTHIGFGAPTKQDSSAAHGSPLGAEEVRRAKEKLGWPLEPTFHVPPEAAAYGPRARERGNDLHRQWMDLWREYEKRFPDDAMGFTAAVERKFRPEWKKSLPVFDKPEATRAASGQVINALAGVIPELAGGSADLTPSNNTLIKSSSDFTGENRAGRYIRFGVREHAMGGILNGLALHKGIVPYGGTFLVFCDYLRPAIRLAALMRLPVIYVFTHDSIGVGEDGPTHQPVEHVAALRAIPGLTVFRPADANETAAAWELALENGRGPTAMALTRQAVPLLNLPMNVIGDGVRRGAYVVHQTSGEKCDLTIVATGSEVSPAIAAARLLETEAKAVRVVSMPSWELFAAQPMEYRQKVLPSEVTTISVEAQVTMGWERWTGSTGRCLGINHFGASAPANVLFEKFGFTPEAIAAFGRRALPQ